MVGGRAPFPHACGRSPSPPSAGTAAVVVPASAVGPVQPNQLFEMTLEPEGGSPPGGPTGAILFIGRIVSSASATMMR